MLLVFAACANEDISVEWVGGKHATAHADFGAQSAYANLHINLEVVHTEPADGCSGITNGDALAGKIALIQRGACAFVEKVLNAQNMGAAAVIVYDNRDGDALSNIGMGGDDDGHNILAVFVSENDGNALVAAVAEGTTTVSLSCPACDTGESNSLSLIF
jgi:Zn-dependent M28 family amino/carboxypeptidase